MSNRIRIAALLALVVEVSACGGVAPMNTDGGQGGGDAGQTACGGCRDSAGGCHRGDTADACGSGGFSCLVCAAGSNCSGSKCTSNVADAGSDAGTSSFPGDACDTQLTVVLADHGAGYIGGATSDNAYATATVHPTCQPYPSRDLVFKVVMPKAGMATISAAPHGLSGNEHFDPVVSLYTGASCAVATEAACKDNGAIDAVETLTYPVQAGPVWIWISSADPAESGGEFDLTVSVQ